MNIELTEKQMDAIAGKTARIVVNMLNRDKQSKQGKSLSCPPLAANWADHAASITGSVRLIRKKGSQVLLTAFESHLQLLNCVFNSTDILRNLLNCVTSAVACE